MKPSPRVMSFAVSRPQPIAEQRLVFNQATGHYEKHVPRERFVRTSPFDWLYHCNRLPGKTTAVALALWFLHGVNKNATFRLTREAVHLAGCSRGALYHALRALEGARLISILRRPGARPIITIHKEPLPVEPEGGDLNLDEEFQP